MKHKLLLIYSWFVRSFFFFWPDIPVFMRLRGWFYGLGMESCGRDFQVTHDASLKCLEKLSVGNNVFIGNSSMLIGASMIHIENEVLIGPHVILISGNHGSINGSFRFGKGKSSEIKVANGSWVAANCTVGPGSTLPSGSVLSANSFLNKEFVTANSLYGGVPANYIKTLKE